MPEWDAPAKLNLTLQVRPADRSGYHPLRSLVQTIEWCDRLAFEESEEDRLVVEGDPLPEGGDNLVWRAVDELTRRAGGARPPLDVHLVKRVPPAAGLAGGSSDAAAALLALAEMLHVDPVVTAEAAPAVGADVPFLLTGGSAWIEGRGERVSSLPGLEGFSVAVVVPPFELATAEVYGSWDRLEGPEGPSVDVRRLPPALRRQGPLRNDLLPAALALRPELGDWMSDLSRAWGLPVLMSGSGPALFACFPSVAEATDAARAVAAGAREAVGAALRSRGAAPAGR